MNKCVYFAEGDCEKALIKALQLHLAVLPPGKVKVYNVVQDELRGSVLLTLSDAKTVLVFDTDKSETETLKKNISLLKRYCKNVKVIILPQVRNLEDEMKRSCNIKRIKELTNSKSDKDFKRDFCKMKEDDCRALLERH